MTGVLIKDKTKMQTHIQGDHHGKMKAEMGEAPVSPRSPRMACNHQKLGERLQETDPPSQPQEEPALLPP